VCLIVLAWHVHPEFPLIVAGNRDEYYRRPTAPAQWWDGREEVLAGRDLESGGTWMGAAKGGRFAAVTNYRRGIAVPGTRSRGELPASFLQWRIAAADFAEGTARQSAGYGGFSLLVADPFELWWVSNIGDVGAQQVQPGIHGLSNAHLDTPWPKVQSAKAEFAEVVAADDGGRDVSAYLRLLHDRTLAPDDQLPDTGIPRLLEKLLSARFIRRSPYGTRASTVLRMRADGSFDFTERRFDGSGTIGESQFSVPASS
jgi:uncharacterized protein with NRDE domain